MTGNELFALSKEDQEKFIRCKKCDKCGIKLQSNVTGKRELKNGLVCDDCFFEEFGDFVDKNPIGVYKRNNRNE
jgi:hypothetical protein